ncbi:hypothetical protein KY290_037420 [Solanum tuberosum]|uniref:Uncharacterized protein n=1 Tax=Solanum tuberosum TaxID=4113 RepID=A0ABQ7TVW4_SOLTU|nr:hypothetical protein KY290_037420 [Solanum tuberosum]
MSNDQQVPDLENQDHPLNNTPIYVTPAPPPNAIPSSWLEISLQGHSLSFNVMIEGREVAIVVQNLTFLAHVVGEGMRLAMEAYNTHVWMAFMLHTPLSVQVPQTLLYHIPTWETPVLYPMEQNLVVMPFLPPTMSNLGMDPLFNPLHLYQQGAPPPVLVPTGSVESSNQGPNNVATSSQVQITTPPIIPISNANSPEVGETLEMLRETRTEITVLREINIMVYKEKYEKKLILICHPNLLKSSLDIRPPVNSQLGNYVLVMNPTLREIGRQERPRRNLPLIVPPNMMGSMNLIIWNCRGE